MDEIKKLRNDIDAMDKKIVPLLRQRLTLAANIGRVKAQQGLPVRDAAREETILARVAEESGDLGPAVQSVYRALLDASCALQEERSPEWAGE